MTACAPLLPRRLHHGPASLAELAAIQTPALGLEQLQVLVSLLVHSQKAAQLCPPTDTAPVRRLNALLLERVAAGAPYSKLISPLLGMPLQVETLGMLTLEAMGRCGSEDPCDPAVVDASGPGLAHCGNRFTEAAATAAAQRTALVAWLTDFARTGMPRLRELGLIGAEGAVAG